VGLQPRPRQTPTNKPGNLLWCNISHSRILRSL
jgi:hypothetical protein